MNIVVMGAGVIGTATAWYLSQEGHDVTVLERNAGAARETSFGNGGADLGQPCRALAEIISGRKPDVVEHGRGAGGPLCFFLGNAQSSLSSLSP